MELNEKQIIIKDGSLNWICIASECESNCCSGKSKVLEGIVHNSIEPMMDIPKNTVPLTDKDYLNMKRYGIDKFVEFANAGMHIKQSDEGCVFLDSDGRCSIHNNRGSSCRSYPFFIDKYTGLCIDTSCPGIGKGWTQLSEIANMIDELNKVYDHQFKLSELFLKTHSSNSNE